MSRGFAKLIEGLLAAGEEAGLFEQVRRPVAAEGELGKDSQACALSCGAFTGRKNLLDISGEVADGGIDLG